MQIKMMKDEYLKNIYPIRKMNYFSKASDSEIAELENMRKVFVFKEKQRLPMSNDDEIGFYYIHDGYAKFIFKKSDNSQIIRIVGPDDLIGFARWFNSSSGYSMVTTSNVTVSFFKKDSFMELQYKSPYIATETTRWLMRVLSSQEEHIYILKSTSARVRVSGTLFLLQKNFGSLIGGKKNNASASIDRKTLADLSGVVIEVLSRILGELENEKIIERQGRMIAIIDKKSLEKIAMLS